VPQTVSRAPNRAVHACVNATPGAAMPPRGAPPAPAPGEPSPRSAPALRVASCRRSRASALAPGASPLSRARHTGRKFFCPNPKKLLLLVAVLL